MGLSAFGRRLASLWRSGSLRQSGTTTPAFAASLLEQHALGEGWAGNTVNTVIFRHDALLTRDGIQFGAFYVDEQRLRVFRRELASGAIAFHDLPGPFSLRDAHNSISMGCDRQGFLHLCYDQHGTRLRYRRTLAPLAIDAWGEEEALTGAHEDRATYPAFIGFPDGQPLLLLYRDGNWRRGSARLKVYDEGSRRWSDRPTPVLSGAEQRPWTSNAYWNRPVVGSDGSLHLAFVWRTDAVGPKGLVANLNVCYACSRDHGLSWRTAAGLECPLPITQVNAETALAVPPGANLINQSGMALDGANRPHIVFYSNDAEGVPQYQHLRWDGRQWHHRQVSRRNGRFDLQGGGTLRIPISRPEIVIDSADNVYIIHRGDLSGQRMAAFCLAAPAYEPEAAASLTLWPEPLGFAEPLVDHGRWRDEGVLSLLVQRNEQPEGDLAATPALSAPVHLADLQLGPRAS